jgi:soluble epoxide hydrolase/lipid-phosphate phosphatase
MNAFEKKTLKTSRGYTYTYYTAKGDESLPTLFFQHGWPDHAGMWEDVATSLRSTKHPIIIPDLLGYDGTDKPTDPAEYRWSAMTQDLIEIIDTEKVSKVISIGHDWGSVCASRLYNYHPDRVVGIILLNVAYNPPTRSPFDLDRVNAMMTQFFGNPLFSYWYLLTAPDGPKIMQSGLERLFLAMHGSAENMKRIFCSTDAMRNYLLNGDVEITEAELRQYAKDPAFKKEFIDRFTRDGFEGPVCWYKANTEQHHYNSDKDLLEGAEKVNIPMLYMGAKEDAVCRPEGMIPSIQAGLLPHLEQTSLIDAAHWTPYEASEEVAENIRGWLKKHFTQ